MQLTEFEVWMLTRSCRYFGGTLKGGVMDIEIEMTFKQRLQRLIKRVLGIEYKDMYLMCTFLGNPPKPWKTWDEWTNSRVKNHVVLKARDDLPPD